MAFCYRTTEQGILITGYEGTVAHLQVPESIGGIPVTAIGRSAFARREDLVYVKLPPTLKRLERLAFSSCPHLERVFLWDSVTDFYGGIFRLCEKLREVEVDLSGGRYAVLRELLTDHDRTLRVRLHLPRGEARLLFPEYLEEFQEDTRARAIHSSFAGMGYIYRECVSRSGVDFRGYDLLFSRFLRVDGELAAEMALDRLCSPHEPRPDAEKLYEDFLREHSAEIIPRVIREGREDWLRLLLERQLLNSDARELGLRLASRGRQDRLVALLMRRERPTGGSGRLSL